MAHSSDDDDNVSIRLKGRFGPQRFLSGHAKDKKKSNAYKRAPKQERDSVARLGGRLTPASGARFKKGDGFVPNTARIECKCTGADSFRVTRDMLDKIEAAGLLNDEIPYIEVEFLAANGKPKERVCILKEKALTNLLNRLKDAEGSASEHSGGRIERNYRRRSPFNK